MTVWYVHELRLSKEKYTATTHREKATALHAFEALSDDRDCLIAEIYEHAAPDGVMGEEILIIQGERTYRSGAEAGEDDWRVTSDPAVLRCKTRGREAREKKEGIADA